MTDFLATVPGLANGQAPLPDVVTGGQPTAAEIAALAAAGVKTVLDLRLPHEPRGFDEAHAVDRVGALMIPHLMLDRGQDQATALRTAQQVGLRDGMLAQQALDYVRRHA